MTQKHVLIDTEKCIGCGICGKICVAHICAATGGMVTTLK